MFLQIALAVPLDRLFDYLPPEDCTADQLQPGIRGLVPFSKTRKMGVLVAIQHHSARPKGSGLSVAHIYDKVKGTGQQLVER